MSEENEEQICKHGKDRVQYECPFCEDEENKIRNEITKLLAKNKLGAELGDVWREQDCDCDGPAPKSHCSPREMLCYFSGVLTQMVIDHKINLDEMKRKYDATAKEYEITWTESQDIWSHIMRQMPTDDNAGLMV